MNNKSFSIIAIVSAVVAVIVAGVAIFLFVGRKGGDGKPGKNKEPEVLLLNGHEYVDLGLSVMWATCNIGANTPTETGNYYAWGETAPKGTYSHSNYVHGKQDFFYKYVPHGQMGYSWDFEPDGRLVLEFQDDAASVNWGQPWRIPTQPEIEELATRCTHTWVTRDGHDGMQFTGPNGNSIFFPACGLYKSAELRDFGTKGFYWSSTLKAEAPNCAYRMFFDINEVGATYWHGRFYGYTVRPVVPRSEIY
ncbi:MAG: hypothetical protein J5769_03995 [Bacteroidales bacterium]|nr:hypothetical protein [Bacteroidales bacterium]